MTFWPPFLSGLVGIGGGVVIVPALVILLSFSQKQAQGTSLGVLLLPVGILPVINYYKQGFVDMRAVLIVALAFIIGGWVGSNIALSVSQLTLKKIFGVSLLMLAIKILFIDK